MDTLHELLSLLIQFSITFLEFVGVVIILAAGTQAVYNYVRHDPHARLKLCKAMAMALEFKLGGEILRTVIVRDSASWLWWAASSCCGRPCLS